VKKQIIRYEKPYECAKKKKKKKGNTNMVMGGVVEENSACPSQDRSVDGRKSTADERPLLVTVMSDCRV
jgi:hypothetical protein